jgi:hypothetical protein
LPAKASHPRPLAEFELFEIREALRYAATKGIGDDGHSYSVAVTSLTYVDTDFQADGIRAALIGWLSDEFKFPMPEY